ncbi:ATP-binding protein [Nonomuraea sp. NPDC050790]|uniref:ATP-binding protein n=1 Tax=Nonomuraea sp. NPDC050790 TaxID=3364371 RepID=UPI003789674E
MNGDQFPDAQIGAEQAGPPRTDPAAGPPGGDGVLFEQVFDADSLYTLRASVEAHGAHAGLPPGRAADLVIAVHELAMNAVRHGAGQGTVTLWKKEGMVWVRVGDAGGEAGAPSEPWPLRHGHGLWLVRTLADEQAVSTGPDGTRTTIAMALPGAAGESATIEPGHRNGRAVLRLSGLFDRSAALELLERAGTPPSLVLDLTDAGPWDADGLAVLVTLRRRTELSLIGVPSYLRDRIETLDRELSEVIDD